MANERSGKPGANGQIVIHGAREHNLKNLTVSIPRERLVVITGVSGSGKSTLAFDLLFAEGQRRFLDSMNAYARQFVEQLPRPDVDLITGIPPTVSIEQRSSRGGGKSTVATITEAHHFLRLLFARLGLQHCPECGTQVEPQSRDEVGRQLRRAVRERGELRLLAPLVRSRKGIHSDVPAWAWRHGYREIRADGVIYAADQPLKLDRYREHNVEVVTGCLKARGQSSHEAQGLVDAAFDVGRGTVLALDLAGGLTVHSTERACLKCGRSFPPLDPKMFSYNSPQGWCPRCRGFGELFDLPDVDRGARADAIEESWFEWTQGSHEPCPECLGARLNALARAVRLPVGNSRCGLARLKSFPSLADFGEATADEAEVYFRTIRLEGRNQEVARDILPEIRARVAFLREVGVGYLQLNRAATTLSGGEAQRIRLAAQLGSNLTGVLYVLDEPTIGLHPRDNERLLATLAKLKKRGNSLVVVEHDEETMRHADYIVDLGPGAGVLGGELVAAGPLEELLKHTDSITGRCLRQPASHPSRGKRRPVTRAEESADTSWLVLENATLHNLKNLTVRFPLGRLVAVTGVSGSGKSTLVRECLLPSLQSKLARGGSGRGQPTVAGWESIRAVYEVDQSPIGRTPRSVPATYVGFFDDVRWLFSQVPEARLRGYGPGRFSFNSPQGRCPACEGAGTVKLQMSFLPPAYMRCDACSGVRFNRETLDIRFSGLNIAQVLELSVSEAIEFFNAIPKVRRQLEALRDTGLEYLKLGQASPTLSGGEAQRVKLVTHLLTGLREPLSAAQRSPKHNLFILEEPTIGLHIADVKRLIDMLHRLADAGHSVIVIEHNLDIIAEADWVIDLGPEGGDEGGRIVAEGPPEEVARNKCSHTGRFLRKVPRKA